MKTRVSTHCSPELMQEHAGGREKRGELCALLHGDGFGVDADRVTMEFAAVHDVNRLLCPHRALEAESGGAGPRDVHLGRGQSAGKAEEGLAKKHLQLSLSYQKKKKIYIMHLDMCTLHSVEKLTVNDSFTFFLMTQTFEYSCRTEN